jgi:leader peptidase (prepilin peptidase)/N-methyltransferase
LVDPNATFIFILGLLFGSFGNVVIYRMPNNKSVIHPRSSCPKCNKMIAWYDNIPVLSWLFLMGKCRQCKVKIPIRYPLVELITGLIFLFLYLHHGLSWLLLEHLVFAFSLVVCTFIDLDHMILPDEFTLSGIVIGLVGAILIPEREFLPSLLGVLVGGGILWAIGSIYAAIKKIDGIGGGDVKLLAWIGAVLGWQSIPFVILASSLVGSLVGVIYMIRTKSNMQAAIPFGPFLAAAAVLYIFFGRELSHSYFELFIPSLSIDP